MESPRDDSRRSGEATAGLPLSVGSASVPVRCFLALLFGVVGAVSLAGAVAISRIGPIAATVLAIIAIVPLGCISLIAAAFTVAPFSRFGIRLDRFLGGLTWARLALVFAAFWFAGTILIAATG